ncbi:unnamed protein product [Pylaiella littoralis]
MDVLFAQPTQPAADPRVRAFAELTLKVLSSGEGRNTSLLADKAAFFEFMDRVNESVLLGLGEPPPAASAIAGNENNPQQDNADSGYRPVLDNDAVASPPPQPSIIDSGDKPFAVSNPFEPWSSTYFCPPKRHPRQTNDNAALGHPALPSQPLPPWSARSQTVRFDGGIVDEDLYTSDRPSPKPLHYRKPGERIAQHSQREQHVRRRTAEASEDDESPLSSCGFDGPELLQGLRRWRNETTADLNTDCNLNRPPFRPRKSPPTSGGCRPSPPLRRASPLPVSAWVDAGLAPGAPPLLPQPAPGPLSLSFEENRVASLAGRQTDETVESQELHTTTEKTGVHSKKADENGGVEDGRLREKSTASTEEFHPRGGVGQSGAQGRARRASPALSDQRPKMLVDEEADVSARHKGRRSGSAGARRGALMTEARGRFGGAEGRGEGNAQVGAGEDAAEVSLDLSDCSEEKLVTLLERGRRRGNSQAG